VCEPRPARALEQAQAWAAQQGAAVLATGSVYLVGELLGGTAGSDTLAVTRAGSEGSAR